MSEHTRPWKLANEDVGVGSGFNDVRAFVVGADGKEVSGTIHHARRITEYDDGSARESTMRPHYDEGEPFPYSANARLIAAAPRMEAALRAIYAADDPVDPSPGWTTRDYIEFVREKARSALAATEAPTRSEDD